MRRKADPADRLELTELLGSGGERDCWVHPADSRLVVKTTHTVRRRPCQNDLDYRYHKWLTRTGKLNPHIPRIVGWCQTQYGKGLVCERTLNADGTPALDLAQGLGDGRITPKFALTLIEEAFAVFFKNGITICDEEPNNFFCVRGEAGVRLVVVDGFGHRHRNLKTLLRNFISPLAGVKTRENKRRLVEFVRSFA